MRSWLKKAAFWARGRVKRPVGLEGVERFVFVITYGRSGSTLVQKLLGTLPGWHMAGENFGALFGLARSYDAVTRTRSERGQEPRALDDPWYGADQFDPRQYGEALSQAFIREVIRPVPGTRVAGFKEIRYFANIEDLEPTLRFLRTYFRPAQFIFNIRNPASVSKSGWWRKQDGASVVDRVDGWNTFIRDYVAGYPDDCFLVDYDEYTQRPESLASLFAFVRERYIPEHVQRVLAKRLDHLQT